MQIYYAQTYIEIGCFYQKILDFSNIHQILKLKYRL